MYKKIRHLFIAAAVIISLTACTSSASDSSAPEASPSEETAKAPSSEETALPDETASSGSSRISDQALHLCGTYFLRGEYGTSLTIYPGDADAPEKLTVQLSDYNIDAYQIYDLEYQENAGHWPLILMYPEAFGNSEEISAKELTLASDNSSFPVLELKSSGSDTMFDGSYYSTDLLVMPEVFTRPLNKADLLFLDKDQLSFLRNQFYAVHGRVFKTDALNDYFQAQPWYQCRFSPNAFPRQLLTNLELRNITFLLQAEKDYDPDRFKENQSAWQSLENAPYLSLVSGQEEVSVSIPLVDNPVEDMGICYRAQGEISLPVTITREEYDALLQGKELSVKINALTGESIVLKYLDKTILDEPGFVFEKDGYEEPANFRYHADTDTFSLWFLSDDTIFCLVYSGDIYILKGACEEYALSFNQEASQPEESPHLYREIDFDEPDNSLYEDDCYFGNKPVFDEKGYLKGLYYWGD